MVEKLEAAEPATGSKLAKTDAHSMYKRLDRSISSMLFINVVSSNNDIIITSCMMPMPMVHCEDINSWLEKSRVSGARNSHVVKAYVSAGGRRIRRALFISQSKCF